MSATASMSLRALATQALEAQAQGNDSGAFAAEGESLSLQAISALTTHARVSDETREALEKLQEAKEKSATDPYACRAYLRAMIQVLSEKPEHEIDPWEMLELLERSLSDRLSNGTRAFPLFTELPKGASLRKGETMLTLPKVEEREHGLFNSGLRRIVPTTDDDERYLKMMIALRGRSAEALARYLGAEMPVHMRMVLRLALVLVKDASVWHQDRLEREFEEHEDGLKRSRDGKIFHCCPINPKQDRIFVCQKSDTAYRIIAGLLGAQARNDAFWKREFDVEPVIQQTVSESGDLMITPASFLAGVPGLVAARHEAWKLRTDKKGTASVSMLLDRRATDGRWRWVLCSPEGVSSLFDSRELRFHDWTDGPVPAHLTAFLKQATQITG